MLVIERKLMESIKLETTENIPAGTTMTVTVVSVQKSGCSPGKCRLSFNAPKSVQIDRVET